MKTLSRLNTKNFLLLLLPLAIILMVAVPQANANPRLERFCDKLRSGHINEKYVSFFLKLQCVMDVDIKNMTVTFKKTNVQIVDGTGDTIGCDNGRKGNLIVGYDEDSPKSEKTGCHNLIVGEGHTYTNYGGVVFGRQNSITGESSTVTGGELNKASGHRASVSGGAVNEAIGSASSVSGGSFNKAYGTVSSILGGRKNQILPGVPDFFNRGATIAGGVDNTVDAETASVSGGSSNVADEMNSTVSGSNGLNTDSVDQHLP